MWTNHYIIVHPTNVLFFVYNKYCAIVLWSSCSCQLYDDPVFFPGDAYPEAALLEE